MCITLLLVSFLVFLCFSVIPGDPALSRLGTEATPEMVQAVNELAEMSGFNSVVSYNMAFRLFMNENPSDWCRKERQKIRKKKK